MALFIILLVEALSIAALLIWVSLLTLRASGRLGPRRGSWPISTAQQELGEHPLNRRRPEARTNHGQHDQLV